MDASFLVSNLTTVLQILGLACILIVSVYLLWKYLSSRPKIKVLERGPYYLVDDMQVKITSEKIIPSIDGVEYTLSFWLYNRNSPENANWKNEYNKLKGVINHEQSPTIFFHPPNSELNINIGYIDRDEILQYETIVLPVKKQHWQHYVITVKDKTVDFYTNGVLEKSLNLEYEPYFSKKNMFIGEKNNQSLLTIANISWGREWCDSNQIQYLFKQQRNDNIINREPDTYVEQLHKRFS
jgi:hypothetical protein